MWFFNKKTDEGVYSEKTDTLVFDPLTREDFGTYYCYGRHLSKTFIAMAKVHERGKFSPL